MDGEGKKPRGGKKAARPGPATLQQQAAAGAALETPALSDDAAADDAQQIGVVQPDVASVDESRGAEEEDDNRDDDEQVERFYALLANIRAMRGLPLHKHDMVFSSSSYGGAGAGGDTDNNTAGDSTRTKKRLRRSAEPPWRPVFRMEDFEEPSPPASSCKMMKRRTRDAGHDDQNGDGESSGSARPPVAVVNDAARGGTVPTV